MKRIFAIVIACICFSISSHGSQINLGGSGGGLDIATGDGEWLRLDGVNDMTGALDWAADGGGDIGAIGAKRPDNVYIKTAVVVGDASTTVTDGQIAQSDNTDADAVAADDLTIQAANKTAGTGGGGDIIMNAGTSVGGLGGFVNITSRAMTLKETRDGASILHRIENLGSAASSDVNLELKTGGTVDSSTHIRFNNTQNIAPLKFYIMGFRNDEPGTLIFNNTGSLSNRSQDVLRVGASGSANRDVTIPNGGLTISADIAATGDALVVDSGDIQVTAGNIDVSAGAITASGAITSTAGAVSGLSGSFGTGSITGGSTILNSGSTDTNLQVRKTTGADGNALIIAENQDNGTADDAVLVAKTSGNDARLELELAVPAAKFTINLDNDDSDKAKLDYNSNEFLSVTTAGDMAFDGKMGFHGEAPVAQGAAIADASGGATVDTEARAAINTLLAHLRLRGDIDSPLLNAQSLGPDGTDEYATVPDDAAFTSDAFSVCMWLKGASQTNAVVAQWDTGTSNRSWNIGTSGANLQCLVDQDGTFTVNSKNYTGSQTVMDSSWHHACCTFDAVANNMSLYVDGVLDGAPTKTLDDNLASVHNAATTVIHAAQNGGASNHWTGLMDEVAFFDTQLTGSQVSEVYNASGAVDISATTAAGNLVAWWRYEDALVTSLADSSGNGHTAVGTNMEAADLDADTPP